MIVIITESVTLGGQSLAPGVMADVPEETRLAWIESGLARSETPAEPEAQAAPRKGKTKE